MGYERAKYVRTYARLPSKSVSKSFGFWVLDFRCRILDFGFRISDSRFRIPVSDLRMSDFGFQISDFGFRVDKVRYKWPLGHLSGEEKGPLR